MCRFIIKRQDILFSERVSRKRSHANEPDVSISEAFEALELSHSAYDEENYKDEELKTQFCSSYNEQSPNASNDNQDTNVNDIEEKTETESGEINELVSVKIAKVSILPTLFYTTLPISQTKKDE